MPMTKRIRLSALCLALSLVLCACASPGGSEPTPQPFTNRQGREETVCAHEGCKNTVARSGDTAFCEEHSARCRDCGCYIGEGEKLCADCLYREIRSMEFTEQDSRIYAFDHPAAADEKKGEEK